MIAAAVSGYIGASLSVAALYRTHLLRGALR